MKVEEMESRIMKRVITDALAAGFFLSVYDGEAWAVKRSQDADEIFGALRSTDEDWLQFYTAKDGDLVGHVRFIYGNDGYDVVADNSVALEPYLKGASSLANSLERRT